MSEKFKKNDLALSIGLHVLDVMRDRARKKRGQWVDCAVRVSGVTAEPEDWAKARNTVFSIQSLSVEDELLSEFADIEKDD